MPCYRLMSDDIANSASYNSHWRIKLRVLKYFYLLFVYTKDTYTSPKIRKKLVTIQWLRNGTNDSFLVPLLLLQGSSSAMYLKRKLCHCFLFTVALFLSVSLFTRSLPFISVDDTKVLFILQFVDDEFVHIDIAFL